MCEHFFDTTATLIGSFIKSNNQKFKMPHIYKKKTNEVFNVHHYKL